MKTDQKNLNNQSLLSDEGGVTPKLPGRRKLLAGIVSAPVVLAVSGRSALACTNTSNCAPMGLSPLAWVSIHPENGVTINPSHTIERTCLGKSPGYWTPNCGGSAKTFQGRWPKPPCGKITGIYGKTYRYYDGTYLYAKGVSADDPGWNDGCRFPSGWGAYSGKVISRKLMDAASSELDRHICAAYLNIHTFGIDGYPVQLGELQRMATGQPIGGRIFTISEVKEFLDQTWS